MTECPTPTLFLDLPKMRSNIRRMHSHLAKSGVKLCLHGKTCKNIEVAKECSANAGIAVSTLAEAEYFLKNGIADITYAVGITPNKFERVNNLARNGANIKILVDNLDTARALAAYGFEPGVAVLIEIDCDGHRCGVRPDDPELLAIASCLARGGKKIAGVLTHAGSAYELASPGPEEFRKLADKETSAARRAAARLRLAGAACPVVSVGSTPTALYGEDFEGITEVRAGVFPFMDCVMASLGICTLKDIAISVGCSVISIKKAGTIIIDAGWTALSTDRGRDFEHFGYGVVCDASGAILPGLRLADLNQEHGIIRHESSGQSPVLKPGSKLRILPVHACATANAFQAYNVVNNGQENTCWLRCQGW